MAGAPFTRNIITGDYQMIKRTDFYHIEYFEYGEAFYGSCGHMRYRIARLPQKNVHYGNSKDKNKDALLECVIWRGPLAYARTQEEKCVQTFPFGEDGAEALTVWLNEQYTARRGYWDEAL